MNAMDNWPMAKEYSVWNAVVAALHFWTADLKAHVLSSAIKEVYTAFFHSTSTHILHQQSDEILFSCFMTMLNDTFESKLSFEGKGYESCSENFNIPTPLWRTFKIHHVSSVENASFDPVPVTPCTSSLYVEDWHTTPLMMMTTQKMIILPLAMYHKYSTMHLIHEYYLPGTSFMLPFTWKMKKETSKLFHWSMNIGLLKKFLTDHYAYMNIHDHMDYAPTCVHIQITKPPLILKPWI